MSYRSKPCGNVVARSPFLHLNQARQRTHTHYRSLVLPVAPWARFVALWTRSPMYALFAETLDGAVTIRAFEQEVRERNPAASL